MLYVHSLARWFAPRTVSIYSAAALGAPQVLYVSVPLGNLSFPTPPTATTAQPPRSGCARTTVTRHWAGMQKHSSRSRTTPRCRITRCAIWKTAPRQLKPVLTSRLQVQSRSIYPAAQRPAPETTLWSSRSRNHIAELNMNKSTGFKQLLLAAPTGSPLSHRTRSKVRRRQWRAASNP